MVPVQMKFGNYTVVYRGDLVPVQVKPGNEHGGLVTVQNTDEGWCLLERR